MYYVFFEVEPNFIFGAGLYSPFNPIMQSDYHFSTYSIRREDRQIVGAYHAKNYHIIIFPGWSLSKNRCYGMEMNTHLTYRNAT